jgi:TetR/AcrR family transcriptional repressor of mexJK operon
LDSTAPEASPPPAAADEDASRKHLQILNGAAAVFAQDGYEGASMSRIAAEAGVSKGTLYNYFPGKAELFIATVRRDCSRWIELVFDELDANTPPETTLRQVGLHMISMLLSDPALTMYRMVIAEAEKFPELAEAFYKAGPAHATAHLACYLRGATARGELAIDDADFAAGQFYALMQTHLCIRRRLHLIPMPTPADLARVVDAAVAMFLNTYGSVAKRAPKP